MDETKLEAGLNASLELQCRKTMEIRTKHVRAGFAAGLEGLKAMEIRAKQYDKEGALFWTSKRKKKQARKNGPPQYVRIHSRNTSGLRTSCIRGSPPKTLPSKRKSPRRFAHCIPSLEKFKSYRHGKIQIIYK